MSKQSSFSCVAFACFFTVFLPGPGRLPALDLHVSPSGQDAWSGRLAEPNGDRTDGPLASLAGARDAIRRVKAAGPLREAVRVLVKSGTYRMNGPFVLGPEDSGTAEFPITYLGEHAARPVVSGGRVVKGWRKEADRWVADVPEARSGDWGGNGFWVKGERRPRARSPNDGYFFTQGKDPARGATAFRHDPKDLHPGPDLEQAEVLVYHSWETSRHRIAALEEATSTVVFTGPANWAFENWGPKQRYQIENTREALDAPGEWLLDRKAAAVVYFPKPGEDLASFEAVIPVARQLVLLAGEPSKGRFVEHVRFDGLSFQHNDWALETKGHSDGQAASSIPAAVEAVGARHVAIVRCEIAHTGTYGVWFRAGSQDCRLEECEVHDLGAGGVRLGETGDAPSPAESSERNTVHNCFIHDGGRYFSSGVGVFIGRSSHNIVTHDEICDFDYSGMSVGWSWGYAPSSAHDNRIEHNHIHDVGRGVLDDLGGIYTLGISPGTVERFNRIHDIRCYKFGGWGVYTDEGSTGIVIENNLVYETTSGCFHQHYGKENVLRNNVFAFAKEGVLRRSRKEDHTSFILERNLVLTRGSPIHINEWEDGHYRMDSNLYWDYSSPEPKFLGKPFSEWKAAGRDASSIIADPLCTDPEHGDFSLKPGSPAGQIGFQPIDPTGIGLVGDPDWVGLPKKVRRVSSAVPPKVTVEVEEEVARCAPAKNGAGPLWCYGAPLIVRRGDTVFASAQETGEGVQPLSNTRPRLFRRKDSGSWELLFAPPDFREREPCPIVSAHDAEIALSRSVSTAPPGTWYGASDPHLLLFDPPGSGAAPIECRPPWPASATFTDHSYRGVAADRTRRELLLLNIDAKTSEQHWALRSADGKWTKTGSLRFPIRACYPQVALQDGAAHVLAIGDIVEPNDEWQRFKKETTGSEWDYVFRRLFYASSPALEKEGFREPIEIENLDSTAGSIRNLDLWVDPSGRAHVLYWKQAVQSAAMRDRFFKGVLLTRSLEHVVLKEGAIVSRETIIEGGEGRTSLAPDFGRLQALAGGRLLGIAWLSGVENGKAVSGLRIAEIAPRRSEWAPVPLAQAFTTFFTACERGGSEPSTTIDLFGVAGDGERLRYARVRVE